MLLMVALKTKEEASNLNSENYGELYSKGILAVGS